MRTVFALLPMCAAAVAPADERPDARVALVVGVGSYDKNQFKNPECAVGDATALADALQLSGDQDHNAPPDGVEVLERKVGAVYKLYDKPENFRSVLYKNTGHEYLPEMRQEMVDWFVKHLPVAP